MTQPTTPSKPPVLATDTGEHPVIIIQPEPRGRWIAGILLDLTVLVGLMVLIGIDKVSAEAGLPWIAVLLGVKARDAMRSKNGPPASGPSSAIMSILGIVHRGDS